MSDTATKTTATRNVFETREGTFKDVLAALVLKNVGKPIKLDEATKKLYGDTSPEWRTATKMVILGLNVAIKTKKLPCNKIVFEGRGEEATFMLSRKSAAKRK
jgi:hypothetical protein